MADRTPNTGMKRLVKDITNLEGRVTETERPTGTQYAQLVQQVQTALANINTQVQNAINTYSYTKANIDNMLAGKANTSHTHDASQIVSGTLTIPVNASGVTSSGDLRGATLYATGAPGYNITGTRVAGWWESATGRAGTASSSERFKTNIATWDGDPQKVLEIVPVLYQYIDEVERVEAQKVGTVPFLYNPAAHAHTELGIIAERLVELGFWEVIVWERNEDDTLRLDDNGKPIPFGVHYHLIAVLQQVALQWLNRRISAIEDHLGLTAVK